MDGDVVRGGWNLVGDLAIEGEGDHRRASWQLGQQAVVIPPTLTEPPAVVVERESRR